MEYTVGIKDPQIKMVTPEVAMNVAEESSARTVVPIECGILTASAYSDCMRYRCWHL